MSLGKVVDAIDKVAGPRRDEITLVVVSKGRSVQAIEELYQAGVRDFGENRLHEALPKIEKLPKDIRWHFIGKLQRNKVTKVVGHFALIHSIDTPQLAEKLSELSLKRGVVTSVLLEVNSSGEAAKSGFSPDEWKSYMPDLLQLGGIEISGLMTMAPLTENKEVIRSCFSRLRQMNEEWQLPVLSMGMSHDFAIGIEEGATMLRIGSAVFEP